MSATGSSTRSATATRARSATALDGPARIEAAFAAAAAQDRAAFMPYAVAGYPDAAASTEIAVAVIDGGADLVEIGLPYSDPVADGGAQDVVCGGHGADPVPHRLVDGILQRGRPRRDLAHVGAEGTHA